jgi:hypothetical protein
MYNEFTGILVFLNEYVFSRKMITDIINIKPEPESCIHHKKRKITNITSGYCYSTKNTRFNDITLIFYGKITNYVLLSKIVFTDEDNIENEKTEEKLIILMYLKYGLDYTLQMIEGEFTFVILDQNIYANSAKMYIVRDGLGCCPLYMLTEKNTIDRKMYGFAFSPEYLHPLCESNVFKSFYNITEFNPGTYSEFSYQYKVLSHWNLIRNNVCFFHLPICDIFHKYCEIKVPKLFPMIDERVNIGGGSDLYPIVLLVKGYRNDYLLDTLQQTLREYNYRGNIYTFCLDTDPLFIEEAKKISEKYNTRSITIPETNTESRHQLTMVGEKIQNMYRNTEDDNMFMFADYIASSTFIKSPVIFSAHDPTMIFEKMCDPLADVLLRDLECRNVVLNFHTTIENQMNITRSFHLEWYRPFLNETYLKYYFHKPQYY